MKKIMTFCALAFITAAPVSAQKFENDGKDLINATAWTQTSGEWAALNLQAYQLGKMRLAQIITQEPLTKPRAVVLDIDETVLDNSPYEAHEILSGRSFDQNEWEKWTALAIAEPIPGALDFLNFAKNNGVEIFYVSNRNESERSATLRNLQDKHFPFADNEHLILKTTTSSKKERRRQLSEKYDIVLFFGDNLSDFSDMFYYENGSKPAVQVVKENAYLFGSKFIILPNPMYGDWESALMKQNPGKTNRREVKIRSLNSYSVPKKPVLLN